MTPVAWHLIGWFGLLVLAMLNGIARGVLYDKSLGSLTAKALSSFIVLALFAAFTAVMHRIRPLPGYGQAWLVGAVWLLATVGFEFAMGRMVNKASWAELIAMYKPATGSLWLLVLAAVMAMPALFHWLRQLATPLP